jgi:hypothetical protein
MSDQSVQIQNVIIMLNLMDILKDIVNIVQLVAEIVILKLLKIIKKYFLKIMVLATQ